MILFLDFSTPLSFCYPKTAEEEGVLNSPPTLNLTSGFDKDSWRPFLSGKHIKEDPHIVKDSTVPREGRNGVVEKTQDSCLCTQVAIKRKETQQRYSVSAQKIKQADNGGHIVRQKALRCVVFQHGSGRMPCCSAAQPNGTSQRDRIALTFAEDKTCEDERQLPWDQSACPDVFSTLRSVRLHSSSHIWSSSLSLF